MSRLIKVLILLALVFGLFMFVLAGLLFVVSNGRPINYVQKEFTRLTLAGRQGALAQAVGTDTSPIRFVVNSGDTPPLVAQNLLNASLISDPDLYVDYAFVNGLDVEMEAGVYFPRQNMTIPEIAVLLTDSSKSHIPFRILEGWRIEEIANAVDASGLFGFTGNDFLSVVGPGAEVDPTFAQQVGLPAGKSLEGFLFPDTYQLPPDITATGLRDQLTETFLAKVGLQVKNDAAAQGYSLYEIVTLASITERESVHADENPKIAGVYRNRLDIDMKLDADPTVQYGMGFQQNTWWPQITQDHYTSVISDYNTYRNFGLPPGPIANPGLSAILGATYPEETDFLYFRAACDGSGFHNFARTFDEHLANGC